jgi:RimJ/RimL family protein N-acetyltransferase
MVSPLVIRLNNQSVPAELAESMSYCYSTRLKMNSLRLHPGWVPWELLLGEIHWAVNNLSKGREMMYLTLRPLRFGDLEIFYRHQADPLANEMAHFPARSHQAFMEQWQHKILNNPKVFARVILVDGEVAGNIVSWPQEEMRLLGYWLGRDFWGRGVATEALGDFLGLLKQRPLYALVSEHNLASQRVLEKCGFSAFPSPYPVERLYRLS